MPLLKYKVCLISPFDFETDHKLKSSLDLTWKKWDEKKSEKRVGNLMNIHKLIFFASFRYFFEHVSTKNMINSKIHKQNNLFDFTTHSIAINEKNRLEIR